MLHRRNDRILLSPFPPEYFRALDLLGKCPIDDPAVDLIANGGVYLCDGALHLLDCPSNIGALQLNIISVCVGVVQNQIITPFRSVPAGRENISIHFELTNILAVWVSAIWVQRFSEDTNRR